MSAIQELIDRLIVGRDNPHIEVVLNNSDLRLLMGLYPPVDIEIGISEEYCSDLLDVIKRSKNADK